MSDIGSILDKLGDIEGALSTLEQALVKQEANLGRNHPSTLLTVQRLALLYLSNEKKGRNDEEGRKKKLNKARELYTPALKGGEMSGAGCDGTENQSHAFLSEMILRLATIPS